MGVFFVINFVDITVHSVAAGITKSYDGIVEFEAQKYPTTAPGAYPSVTQKVDPAIGMKPVSHVGVQSSPDVSTLVKRFMGEQGMNLAKRVP